jgi:hypothetical protein
MDSVKPSSRSESKKLGYKTYFTGKPCKRGNVAERMLNGRCLCRDCKDIVKIASMNWYYKTKPKRKFTEKQKSQNSRWKQNNKAKVNAINSKRRAGKVMATPIWFSEFDEFVIQEAFDLCQQREAKTKIKWSVDHMVPLKAKNACGLHCANNIQVIPQSLNYAKRNDMIFTNPFEWLQNARI